MVIKKAMDESTLKKSKINYQNNYQSYFALTCPISNPNNEWNKVRWYV